MKPSASFIFLHLFVLINAMNNYSPGTYSSDNDPAKLPIPAVSAIPSCVPVACIPVPCIQMSTFTIPTFTMPNVTAPTFTIETVTLPTFTVPTFTTDTITIPTFTTVTITTPTFTTFTVTEPTFTTPTFTIPTVTIATPTFTTFTVTEPTFTTPTFTTPTFTTPTFTTITITITITTPTFTTFTVTVPTFTIMTVTVTMPTITIPTITVTCPPQPCVPQLCLSTVDNYYIQFYLSLNIFNGNIVDAQLATQLTSIFINALDISSDQINITIIAHTPGSQTITSQVRFFSTTSISAESLLILTQTQLAVANSKLRQANLTSQLNQNSVMNISRHNIYSKRAFQESLSLPNDSSKSGTKLSIILLTLTISSVAIFLLFIITAVFMRKRKQDVYEPIIL